MITANNKVRGKVYLALPARRYREYTGISLVVARNLPRHPTDPVFLVSDTIKRPCTINERLEC